MNNTTRSILLAGVGGQGIIRASDILSLAMIEAGYDVRKSEVHGMAQRGGCVTSHVRYGKKVYSPMAKKGDVDILVSFEKLETLRYLDYLKPDGKVIINDEEIYPPSVNLGDVQYPNNIIELIAGHFSNPKVISASEMASRAGNHKTSNSAILGALSLYLDIQMNFWESVLRNAFSEKILEANLKAFNFGRNA